MQQTALLLDIGDLTPIADIASDDIQQLEQQIALCRASDRPDLAAPYALQLYQYHNQHDERENRLWFDAIAEDDIFLVKALVASGFDINTTTDIAEFGYEWSGSAIHSALERQSGQCIVFLLQRPDLNLDAIGQIYIEDKEHPLGLYEYVVPLLRLYHSDYKLMLNNASFDVNIRWGGHFEFTPLLSAIEALDVDFVRWLLERNANPNIKLFFNGMCHETPFGNLATWYFCEPDDLKLGLMISMAHYGASPMVECGDGCSVCYKILESNNESLISVFDLYDIQELIATRSVDLDAVDEHMTCNSPKTELYIFQDLKHASTSTIKANILNALKSKGEFVPADWITDLSIIQQDESIQIYIEQQEHQVTAMAVTLPDELSYLSSPFTTADAMGLDFIQRPLSWWQEVEHYLHRYHITLIDPLFFDNSREQLEQGYC
ncbi:hypothetical protein [Aeromonas sobria]|uniref:hypothetical protein n=1 Tax=Aeromonas sobria TaxID=646 RepID=UPI003F419558